jgi:hypothetical protein
MGLHLFKPFKIACPELIEGFNPPDRVRGPFKSLKEIETENDKAKG